MNILLRIRELSFFAVMISFLLVSFYAGLWAEYLQRGGNVDWSFIILWAVIAVATIAEMFFSRSEFMSLIATVLVGMLVGGLISCSFIS